MDAKDRIGWLNQSCPDGGFLQSEAWRILKQREGFATEHFEGDGFWANVIEHTLPFVGKYWYVPRGPIFSEDRAITQFSEWRELLEKAREREITWIRVEPRNSRELELIREESKLSVIRKSPHDMQPREIFVADIAMDDERLLSGMKPKTRYNIRLAEKRGVEISSDRGETAVSEFLRMNRETAGRNRISTHPDRHYRALLESLPVGDLLLLTAWHEGRALAAIVVVFFGDTATYLHGASGDDERGFMAPYLLQWRAMLLARDRGCVRYDFGGVDVSGSAPKLAGVTRFKTGFARNVDAIGYPGSYDVVLSSSRYRMYRGLSALTHIANELKRILTK